MKKKGLRGCFLEPTGQISTQSRGQIVYGKFFKLGYSKAVPNLKIYKGAKNF
jgi:hypothetical protein